MRDAARRSPVARAARPAPFVRGWAVALCLGFGGHAVPAQEVTGPDGLEPCLETHFDPARYQAELEALGWALVPETDRPAAIDALSDAFLAVLEASYNHDRQDAQAIRIDQRAYWDDLTKDRRILTRDGQVLFIGGDRSEDGRLRVSCWLATDDDPLVDGLQQILTDSGHARRDGDLVRGALMAQPLPDSNATLDFYLVDYEGDAMALAAAQGLLTRVIITPETGQ